MQMKFYKKCFPFSIDFWFSPYFMIGLSVLGILGNVLLFLVSRYIVKRTKKAG